MRIAREAACSARSSNRNELVRREKKDEDNSDDNTGENEIEQAIEWQHQMAIVGERTPIKVRFIVYAILFYACML